MGDVMDEYELNKPERDYKPVTNNRVSIEFREAADELARAYPQTFTFPSAPMLTPEERELRRARFDKAVSLMQSFEPEFDGTPYTYSELLAELAKRLESERERVKSHAASSITGQTEGAEDVKL